MYKVGDYVIFKREADADYYNCQRHRVYKIMRTSRDSLHVQGAGWAIPNGVTRVAKDIVRKIETMDLITGFAKKKTQLLEDIESLTAIIEKLNNIETSDETIKTVKDMINNEEDVTEEDIKRVVASSVNVDSIIGAAMKMHNPVLNIKG